MRVLCCNPDGGAFFYIVEGWANAFRALGHQFRRWDGKRATFQQFKPDLYLGCSGWRQAIPEDLRKQFGTKVGIHVNPWGSTVLKALPGEPNINEPPKARQWTISQNPDFVFGYAGKHDLPHMWNFWEEKAGIPTVAMPTAGDYTIYKACNPVPQFTCEVGFVGGRWAYKAININKYLVPVLLSTKSQVYGWGGWQKFPKNRGKIATADVSKLFSSAKVCPAVVEPHTSRYGIDIPERMFKVPLGGGMVVCDPVANLRHYDPHGAFPMAANPKEYKDLVHHYLEHPEERAAKKAKQRKLVLERHTYFSRIKEFMLAAQYFEDAQKAQDKINDLVKKG